MNVIAADQRNRLLAALAPDDLARLQPLLVNVRLVRDQVLVEHGQSAEHVYFIESGIALLIAGTDGSASGVHVGIIGHEGMVGGLALLDATSADYAGAIMQVPGTAMRIPVSALSEVLAERPAARAVLMRSVQSLTSQVMSIAAWNATDTVVQRCVRWLLMAHERLDGDDVPITHEALSVILGVRRSGITAATAALQRRGLVRTSRGRIRILDRHGLQATLDASGRSDVPPANGSTSAPISFLSAQD